MLNNTKINKNNEKNPITKKYNLNSNGRLILDEILIIIGR